MQVSTRIGRWMHSAGHAFGSLRRGLSHQSPTADWEEPRIGLALGGGFARGMAHIGVLRTLERHGIPLHAIAGVSSGSMAAAAFASGADTHHIEAVTRAMKLKDVAKWTINPLGLAGSDRMEAFLKRLLKTYRFEQMKIRLAVVATDLSSGEAAVFRDLGDVIAPIRASCSFPGLFTPVRHEGRLLVDGYVGMDVPAKPLRGMGATHVIAVHIPPPLKSPDPRNMFAVINRCFQIFGPRLESEWRQHCDLVITPEVGDLEWDAFSNSRGMIELGERAAEAAMPQIRAWLRRPVQFPTGLPIASTTR